MKIVGGMKISPFVFYSMTIREAKLEINGHRNELHEAYISNLYATTNAVGSCLGGKNYKPIDPFEEPKKASQASDKQMTADYAARLRAFGIDARDVDESEFDDNWNDLSADEKRNLLFNK